MPFLPVLSPASTRKSQTRDMFSSLGQLLCRGPKWGWGAHWKCSPADARPPFPIAKKTVPPDLQEQLNTFKTLTAEVQQDKAKVSEEGPPAPP